MTDDQYNEILPEITEADAQMIIDVAAEIEGRPAADLRDALEILAGNDPEPLEYIRICLAKNAEAAGDKERHDELLKKVEARQREQLGQKYDAMTEAVEKVRTIIQRVQDAQEPAISAAQAAREITENIVKVLNSFALTSNDYLPEWTQGNKLNIFYTELNALEPFINAELQRRPGMEGKTLNDLLLPLPFRTFYYAMSGEKAPDTDGYAAEINEFVEIIQAARQAAVIAAQNEGRLERRQMKENASKKGAVMGLRGGIFPIFSAKEIWDAFAPARISQMGELPRSAINKETGRVEKPIEDGDLIKLSANDISYRTLMLLNAIMANSVDDYRKFLVSGGKIRFYVKGILDQLEIETRITGNPQQIELDTNRNESEGHTRSRKTTGAIYLERQLKPFVTFIGTMPDGSRYSVLVYEGYDIESDTMTVWSPYLFQLWKMTQNMFASRQQSQAKRIAEGKKPLKADLKPLELNTLFKRSTYKEDDTTLEIAVYLTNVLLDAGKSAHTTEIKYRTLINNCPRLRERLEEVDELPKDAKGKKGNKINKTAQYNSALRRIARAYTLIMTPEKCDALKNFKFEEFTPTKPAKGYELPTKETETGKYEIDRDQINWGRMEFMPPTKSTLDGKIFIKWRRINPNSHK